MHLKNELIDSRYINRNTLYTYYLNEVIIISLFCEYVFMSRIPYKYIFINIQRIFKFACTYFVEFYTM